MIRQTKHSWSAGDFATALVDIIVVRLSVGDSYRSLVRGSMRWPLLISAAVVMLLVALAGRSTARQDDHGHDEQHDGHDHEDHADHADHGHSGWNRPAIYLLAPVVVALLVAPRPLGSFAASRTNSVPSPESPFTELAATNSPTPLTLLEFNQRALDRDGATISNREVTLVGFVMAGEPLRIARFRMSCCAADGQAAIVALGDAPSRPSGDRWVSVVGRFNGMDGNLPRLETSSISLIDQPVDPYEDA